MMVSLPSRSSAVSKQLQLEVSKLPSPWLGCKVLDFAFLQHCLSALCVALLRNECTPAALLGPVAVKVFSCDDIVHLTRVSAE